MLNGEDETDESSEDLDEEDQEGNNGPAMRRELAPGGRQVTDRALGATYST
jgi:hypothetical protein